MRVTSESARYRQLRAARLRPAHGTGSGRCRHGASPGEPVGEDGPEAWHAPPQPPQHDTRRRNGAGSGAVPWTSPHRCPWLQYCRCIAHDGAQSMDQDKSSRETIREQALTAAACAWPVTGALSPPLDTPDALTPCLGTQARVAAAQSCCSRAWQAAARQAAASTLWTTTSFLASLVTARGLRRSRLDAPGARWAQWCGTGLLRQGMC